VRADLAIETAGLAKVFGTTRAVDGIDLAVPPGVVYGVLGPHGAGKTMPDHAAVAPGRRQPEPGHPRG
jgi:ABC-type uncharacterized transport system ATPase subunit